MSVTVDPNAIEATVLRELVNLAGKRVLEIGCGDGRVTWHYAGRAASVIAIDPDREAIARAIQSRPAALSERLEFLPSSIENFTAPAELSSFDIILFARSLC